MSRLLYDILAAHHLWLETDGLYGDKLDLNGADLSGANMQWANMQEANMRGADMRGANMRGADMRGADMQWANMRGADMQWANMCGANLDFSSGVPFSRKGTGIVGDRRLFSQIMFHLTRQDWSQAGEDVLAEVESIKALKSVNWFCEYREDVKPLERKL